MCKAPGSLPFAEKKNYPLTLMSNTLQYPDRVTSAIFSDGVGSLHPVDLPCQDAASEHQVARVLSRLMQQKLLLCLIKKTEKHWYYKLALFCFYLFIFTFSRQGFPVVFRTS